MKVGVTKQPHETQYYQYPSSSRRPASLYLLPHRQYPSGLKIEKVWVGRYPVVGIFLQHKERPPANQPGGNKVSG